MARDNPVLDRTHDPEDSTKLPNLVTVVGRGEPTNYEITVDGEVEMVRTDAVTEATIVSGTTVEGTIDVGVQQFRFSGTMVNVTIDDGGYVSPTTATAHVEYNAAFR